MIESRGCITQTMEYQERGHNLQDLYLGCALCTLLSNLPCSFLSGLQVSLQPYFQFCKPSNVLLVSSEISQNPMLDLATKNSHFLFICFFFSFKITSSPLKKPVDTIIDDPNCPLSLFFFDQPLYPHPTPDFITLLSVSVGYA